MADDTDLKEAFALALFRDPAKPIEAAKTVYPDDLAQALRVSVEWKADPVVRLELARLRSESGSEPDKRRVAAEVWNIGVDDKQKAGDRLRALELYANLKGFIEKPGVQVNTQINQNRIMVVPASQTDDEWEARVAIQQAKLIGRNMSDQNKD